MTDKKKQILAVALELFANDGFNGTSTSKIAKEAGVSEGLIFRHFEHKNGLLNALVQQAVERIRLLIEPILIETDPKKVIQKSIDLPFALPESEYPFWKLQFKLKWENDYEQDKMRPFIEKLTWAFSNLGYIQARKEAEVLNHIIESISIGILREGRKSQEGLKEFILRKYLK
ncbi:TetR/AcrR family transcriptional regulator [Flavobacteriaceae bacterium TP-CH-4]|uniref:TetR/AcrR family transcriptional regulator n=1 Tax=Pelagihabitans pacificus TaxID=2696054 RepID=A0A967B050_9FLAO|nr:TetR/AcrR family transcriptional regulator [Pelagihabitans pacificus]NHF60702.1 TetR/AcrR family transcriptional regulator [Pelagihabitans pacificus]